MDTTGAGDSFAGAFLAGLSQGLSHQEAGRLAIHISANVVTQIGPRLSIEKAISIHKLCSVS